MPRRYAGLGPSRARTGFFGSSTRPMSVASQNLTLPCAITTFPVLLLLSFSWRCLAAPTSSFLHAAVNLRLPSVTVSTHTSASNAVAFQSPAMSNVRMSLFKQSVHSFSFPPRSLRTALATARRQVCSNPPVFPIKYFDTFYISPQVYVCVYVWSSHITKVRIRTHLDLLSIPRLWGKNDKTFRWDQRLQTQNLFMAFKQVPRCR